jgi:hypothetical protein
METGTVRAFEEESPQSTTREEASASAFVGMLACNVILLLMLAA